MKIRFRAETVFPNRPFAQRTPSGVEPIRSLVRTNPPIAISSAEYGATEPDIVRYSIPWHTPAHSKHKATSRTGCEDSGPRVANKRWPLPVSELATGFGRPHAMVQKKAVRKELDKHGTSRLKPASRGAIVLLVPRASLIKIDDVSEINSADPGARRKRFRRVPPTTPTDHRRRNRFPPPRRDQVCLTGE